MPATPATDGAPEPPTPGKGRRGRRGPIKITVNLLARTLTALEEVCGITEESRTDAINRAVQFYAFYQKKLKEGHSVRLVGQDGVEREIHLL
jgi:hypothetical protein